MPDAFAANCVTVERSGSFRRASFDILTWRLSLRPTSTVLRNESAGALLSSMPLRTHIFRRLSSTLSTGSSDASTSLHFKHNAITRHEHANANLDRLIYHEDKKHDLLAKARNVYKVQEAEQWGFQVGWNNAANISSDTPRAVKPLSQAIVSVKDNIATADLDTTCASNILEGWKPTRDATVVRLLREEGSLIIAKTNMDEFGMGSHSIYSAKRKVKNGRKELNARSVGGSSGGSAIAVALGPVFCRFGNR